MTKPSDTPVVILAGGKGFRMREITNTIPKALAQIGPMPIIIHVMSIYSRSGYKNFIICLGYKGELIKEFFLNYQYKSSVLKIKLGKEPTLLDAGYPDLEDVQVTLVDTGLETNTGGRLKKIEKFIETDDFLANYCDVLSDVSVTKVHELHRDMSKTATLVAVKPLSRYGVVSIQGKLITSFWEKPVLEDFVSGGFFVFNKRVFDYLDESSILERGPLQRLAAEKQLAVYQHDGFWFGMDTYKEFEELNALWETGVMPVIGYRGKPPWLMD